MATHGTIDLETLDVKPSATVLSVGAVKFNPFNDSEPHSELYLKVLVDDQDKLGRTTSDSTIAWWAKQDPKIMEEAFNQKDAITAAYYESQQTKNAVWGLSIRFAIQKIPDNRVKPLGTADAVQQGLEQFPEWEGSKFTVCNSDNL